MILNFSEIFYSEKPMLKVIILMTGIRHPTFIILNGPHSEKFCRIKPQNNFLFYSIEDEKRGKKEIAFQCSLLSSFIYKWKLRKSPISNLIL